MEKKIEVGETSEDGGNHKKVEDKNPRAYDNDTMAFISMSQELKDEGNKLFQKRDPRGALVKYEKALKLLPSNHVDVSYLRSNMVACYMQIRLNEYPRAIHECNLALEVTPKYSKALMKRARCYEALNRLDFPLRDVSTVFKMEPNNIMALEVSHKVKHALEVKGSSEKKDTEEEKKNKERAKAPDNIEEKQTEEKLEEKKIEDNIVVKKVGDCPKEKKSNKSIRKAKGKVDENKDDFKEVIEKKSNDKSEDIPNKTAKLIFGEDIRWAELLVNCSLFQLREII
ncbi:hypothetical protein Fmac_029850 [Flemingia macrophylla]|uniref:Tetratricopeptide repeat protein n=1 Tax=Flemingia macrophylla TaxID=520843 RepID=A0ABD1LBP0_9FABA